ncbi:MAG: TerC family protein [Ignavibacteriales bacterium]|jgi:tellurite resistance protein TerC|nr:TerC family protein [Melioribacteraceae bacterium]RJP61555.1 MAG: TerC family protein [Ignavibacteriales bacterium]
MTFYFWLGFLLLVFILLALDLGVFHKKDKAISTKEALLWTGFWIFLSLLFNILIYFAYEYHWLGIGLHVGHDMGGKEAAIKYFTGYVIEKSLSLDNIFVIAMIFAYFRVPDIYQHRVLFWGILGALIMRGIMIYAGAALIDRFDWMIYVFGGLLILTAIKMLISKDEEIHPDENPLVKLARRLYPVTGTYEGHHFFTHLNGRRAITPLFLVLLVIESTDVIFAVDSIPAIFAITTDPYIVFTSNVFAILGLRSLYFALAAMMNKFRYLKISIVIVLIYVGIKMLISEFYHIPTLFSLGVIILILGFGIAISLIKKKENTNTF